jgi:RHS repeat-associated protein
MTLPNGVTTEYGYDAGSQLTSLTYKKDATVLGSLTYEYDQLGRRTKVGGSFARSILPQSLSAAVYNAANQQTSFSGQTLTYDLNGNLTSDGTNSYTWDARDRLVSITGPGVSAGFQYDALGRRSSKAINGSTASYLYDGLNMVQEQAGGASVNLLSGGVDEVFTRTDLGGTHGLLLDGQGSTLASTDAAGAFESEYTYDPFGTTTYSGAPSTNAQQYTGRENDATGLYYYRARYYSPRLQRFISQDPIGFGGGVNHYAYAANNPIKWSDPDGTKIIGVSVGGSAWGGTYYGGGGSGGTLYGYNTADGTLGTASSYGYFYPQPKSTDCAGPKQMVMPWPNTPSSDGKGYAFGGGAGIGLSGVLSNADNWDDLHGDFDTYLVGLGSVSFEFDLGQNNSGQTIWAFQASPKTGLGASLGFAHFKTTTPPDSIGTLQGLGSNLAADISKLYGGCYTGCR